MVELIDREAAVRAIGAAALRPLGETPNERLCYLDGLATAVAVVRVQAAVSCQTCAKGQARGDATDQLAAVRECRGIFKRLEAQGDALPSNNAPNRMVSETDIGETIGARLNLVFGEQLPGQPQADLFAGDRR